MIAERQANWRSGGYRGTAKRHIVGNLPMMRGFAEVRRDGRS